LLEDRRILCRTFFGCVARRAWRRFAVLGAYHLGTPSSAALAVTLLPKTHASDWRRRLRLDSARIARAIKPSRAAHCSFLFVKTETLSFYETAVERTIVRITQSLDEALDLGALAREAALSTFHFHRVFRGMVGETPLEMHRRLRLERSASQLLVGRTAVTAIAFDAGYETHEAFTRAFRQAYGTSPSAFRRTAQEGQEPGCVRLPPIELTSRSGIHFRPTANDQPIRFAKGEIIMNVMIEDMPELRVATVHHVGPYNRISEAFQRLGAVAGPAGLIQGNAMMLAVYYDDPETTPVEQLQSDAAISVPNGARLPDGLVEKRLPAGLYAKTTHLGPYTTLGDTWSRLMGEWLPTSGRRVGSGWSYEVYRNNPSNASADELRTDLYLPIA
jgi:AraC family transcriptional regulator